MQRPVRGVLSPDERRERLRKRLFVLFMLSILVPGSFFIGTARFTPYRMFLLLAILPLVWQVLRGALGRLTAVDVLFVFYAFWLALAAFVHEGLERFELIVVLTVEALGGYLLGRILVRSAEDYKLLMRYFLLGLLILAPFAVVEMINSLNLISEISGRFLEPYNQAVHPPRLGFFRAQTSFEHPILFGLFCSLGFANAFYIYRLNKKKQLFWMGTSGFTTFSSLSSAPLLALMIQVMMIVWDRLVRNLRAKWFVLAGIGLTLFTVLELATPDGAVNFLVEHLTLVPATAEYRMLTFQYVGELVAQFPWFGIPPGEFDLPWWHSGTIDNFWLSTAAEYGIPTTAFLLFAILVHLFKVMFAEIGDPHVSDIRTGHLIAVAALIFLLTTVHLWGPASVMVMTYLGAGAWIYAPERARSPAPGHTRKAARPAPLVTQPAPTSSNSALQAAPVARGESGRVRGSTGRYDGGGSR